MSGGLRDVRTWAMVPTPFTASGKTIDRSSLRRLATAMRADGCEGLIALGVIAEPATLSERERLAVLQTLLDAEAGPLVAAVLPLEESVACAEALRIRQATGRRLAGLMVPVHSADPERVRARLRRMHRLTGARLIVQDLPQATGVTIEVEALAAALDGLGFVDAVKCEGVPTFGRIAALAERIEATLISGLGGLGLIDDLIAGAGAVAVGVTRPAVIVEALRAWDAGEHDRARAVVAAESPLFSFETQPGRSIAIRKEHWRRRGLLASATVRSPTAPWVPALEAHSRVHGYPPR